MLTNDSYNDQNKKQVATKDSTAENKGSHTKKTILRPKTLKISTKDEKRQNNDGKVGSKI